jgi:hypothetical protein
MYNGFDAEGGELEEGNRNIIKRGRIIGEDALAAGIE